jgi:hypothetical protein
MTGRHMRMLQEVVIFVAVAGCVAFGQTSSATPQSVVERFASLDVDGSRLTASGWRDADALFVHPSPASEPKSLIVIASHYGVSESPRKGDKMEFLMGYEELGRIDSASMIFTPTNAGPARQFDSFILVHPDNTSMDWKIEGNQPTVMHLSPKAAMAYVARKLTKTSDPATRNNADRTLTKLKLYP